ncbi:Mitochondrial assembly of ribosomal large subunit protein 1 [Trichoplax sp. H2]|uniref:Mitochondrial assembly of ribosomal large subunit protein 1 n=1 Tax=Trichoplax adhaerens TaxID=10228 RepID=B3RRW9_TRIAD|nr:hypothetical protein TRIADDRAFT_54395 [Trichoplax adhaerens]EDV26423.1 hypothetical protein TRIADDRAFT_54395 [Trichoplax adhaerens]RDD41046.1 Mitochondrial assembly of ribosomal large subunit protein 1 [Trichoplax sp. H2]|eukprot:XP_002110419.1 hypothetical protein TRIADDRAFT_54395 [Trichoplax adhaerens]
MNFTIFSRFLNPITKHRPINLNGYHRYYATYWLNHNRPCKNPESTLSCYRHQHHHTWIQKDVLSNMKGALANFGGSFSFLTNSTSNYLSVAQVTDLLRQERGKDVCAINISPEYCYVDHIVICSGSSTRHLRGMATSLKSQFRGKHLPGIGKVLIEGEDCQDWMAIDIGNMVVHFFLPETREKYQLEKLWLLGPQYDDLTISMSLTEDLMNKHWNK